MVLTAGYYRLTSAHWQKGITIVLWAIHPLDRTKRERRFNSCSLAETKGDAMKALKRDDE
jgi:hypothetical protein